MFQENQHLVLHEWRIQVQGEVISEIR